MGQQTEANVVALELERVRDKVPVLFDREARFFSFIEKKSVEKISARDMRIPLEISPGGSFGAFDPDGGDLGRGSAILYDKAVINSVHMKHAVEYTKKADWATDSSRKAVLQNVRQQLAKAMSEFRRQVDSLCMTDGTGVVATGTTVSAGTGTGGGDVWTCTGDGFGVRLVRKQQKLNAYASNLLTNRTLGAEREVVFHDLANKILHTAAPTIAGITNGDKLVISGLTATPPAHLYGVPYHHNSASSGTWLGLDRSTIPEIRANRVNAGSAALALPFPRLAMNKAGDRVGGDNMETFVAFMHPCQKQAYEELGQLVSVINKQAKEESLDLYFGDNMQMAGAPVKTSFSWDKTRIDFIAKGVWGRAEMNPAGFYEEDGRKIFEIRGPSGGVATASVFYIVASFNLFVDNPAGCAYIDTLAVPSGY